MSAVAPSAWIKSVALHGAIVGIMLLVAYSATKDNAPKIIELVAGPGDDFGAKEAPAEGTAAGVDFVMPKPGPVTPPAPTPVTPPAPTPRVEPKAEPPAEQKKDVAPPVPKKEEPIPDFAKKIKQQTAAAKQKAMRDIAKQRKKEEELRKKQEAEQKKKDAQMSKAEFDKMNANKKVASAASTKPGPTQYKKLDPRGITGGVAGGSSASKAGAGGKALVREDGAVMDLYFSELVNKLRRSYEERKPPGLSDSLKVMIEVRSNANGSLTNPRVVQGSGSQDFDQAVLAAIRDVRMPARPDGKSETLTFSFSMKEE